MTAAQNDDQTIDYSSAEATLTVTNIPTSNPPGRRQILLRIPI